MRFSPLILTVLLCSMTGTAPPEQQEKDRRAIAALHKYHGWISAHQEADRDLPPEQVDRKTVYLDLNDTSAMEDIDHALEQIAELSNVVTLTVNGYGSWLTERGLKAIARHENSSS